MVQKMQLHVLARLCSCGFLCGRWPNGVILLLAHQVKLPVHNFHIAFYCSLFLLTLAGSKFTTTHMDGYPVDGNVKHLSVPGRLFSSCRLLCCFGMHERSMLSWLVWPFKEGMGGEYKVLRKECRLIFTWWVWVFVCWSFYSHFGAFLP